MKTLRNYWGLQIIIVSRLDTQIIFKNLWKMNRMMILLTSSLFIIRVPRRKCWILITWTVYKKQTQTKDPNSNQESWLRPPKNITINPSNNLKFKNKITHLKKQKFNIPSMNLIQKKSWFQKFKNFIIIVRWKKRMISPFKNNFPQFLNVWRRKGKRKNKIKMIFKLKIIYQEKCKFILILKS
jgi:hypothetical protein